MTFTNWYFYLKSYNKLEIILFSFEIVLFSLFVVEFNISLLIKLLKNIHIYNSVSNININKDKTNYISQKFLQSQTSFLLPLSRLILKIRILIILLRNLYFVLKKYNGTWIIIT